MKTFLNDSIIPNESTHHTQNGEIYHTMHHGLTKLEYTAIQAMKGILANTTTQEPNFVAERSVKHAKALFNELNKES